MALSGHLVRQPTDFEPFLAASKDEAEAFLADLQTPSRSDAAVSDVTRFSLGPAEPSSTAEVLIRAYEEFDGMMPDKTQQLLQHLYEGS
ncbi:MAG: hypothetical protein ACYDFQ_05345 [Vulcanimicrobiaceae bacterium]